jgi:dihydrolipoamide dehydrogenase
VKVSKFPFAANAKAHGLGEAVGFVKLVADAEHNEILGMHMVGPEVTELLPEYTLARQWDLTTTEIARNIHAHPTLSEALLEVAHGIEGHMINM